MRLSYGIEIERIPPSNVSLSFDYDSLKGNSGSPVNGRGLSSRHACGDQAYKVKGIHISGVKTKYKENRAQKVTNIGQ